jgi:histidinol-phosphate phosphatase family protein
MKKKNVLICIDRDGTIIYDKKYHLGSQRNWKKLVRFRKGVVKGLSLLNKELPKSKIYFISNQSGVAIKEFPLLTSRRGNEVCKYIVSLLKKKGVKMEKCFICPHTTKTYKTSHPQFHFKERVLCNCRCNKPKPGMVEDALRDTGWNKKDTQIYVIGDRASDIQTAINVNGFGILVPFINRPGEDGLVKRLRNRNKYISRDFSGAIRFLIRRERLR